MAFVYWIKLPEHTDMLTEGYIGVTSKTPATRFKQHKNACNDKRTKSVILYNALRKHKEAVVVPLVEATEEYAYEIEARLRPDCRIGWNTAPGGRKSGKVSGYKLSVETCEKMSKTRSGKKLPQEWCENISKAHLGRKKPKLSAETLAKREESRFYSNMLKYSESWKLAVDAYEDFTKGLSSRNSARLRTPTTLQGFDRMFDKFRNGWVPLLDSRWVSLFNGGQDASHT